MQALSYKDHLLLMARYNAWMNGKMIALLSPVAEAALLEDRGAFFGSVMGTLNHLIVADLLWLNRMRGHPYGAVLAPIDTLPKPSALAQILYPSMAAYAPVRTQLDALFIAFVAGLSGDDIAATLQYHDSRGQPHTKVLGGVLSHVFNHQTHHRGQATTLLSQMGLDAGVTDLHTQVPEV